MKINERTRKHARMANNRKDKGLGRQTVRETIQERKEMNKEKQDTEDIYGVNNDDYSDLPLAGEKFWGKAGLAVALGKLFLWCIGLLLIIGAIIWVILN